MSDDAIDALVLGAGPVGCAAALTLHAAGLRVALLERGAWDRWRGPHLTGVAALAEPTLAAVGLAGLADAACVNRGLALEVAPPSGAALRLSWPAARGRRLVARRDFDLAARARVDASSIPRLDHVEHTQISPARHGFTVTATAGGAARCWRTPNVFVAEGSGSNTARVHSLEAPVRQRRLYLGATLDAPLLPADHYALRLSAQPGRRLLLFALGEGRTYVELEIDGRLDHGRSAREALVRDALLAHPDSAPHAGLAETARWSAITLHVRAPGPRRAAGLVLLGDAATTLDPIASSGLLHGLRGVAALARRARPPGRAGGSWWSEPGLADWEAELQADARALRRSAALFRLALDRPWLIQAAARSAPAGRLRHLLGEVFNGGIDHQRLWRPDHWFRAASPDA